MIAGRVAFAPAWLVPRPPLEHQSQFETEYCRALVLQLLQAPEFLEN
jgi:hypothetical protein